MAGRRLGRGERIVVEHRPQVGDGQPVGAAHVARLGALGRQDVPRAELLERLDRDARAHEALPALHLEREDDVVALVEVERGRPLAHAEPDRPGVGAAGAQPHLEVPALPHPDRRLELGPRHDEPHGGVAAAERRERLDRLGRREGQVAAADDRVHGLHASPRDRRPRALGGQQQLVAEAGDRRGRELEPHSPGVTAPPCQRRRGRPHETVEVDAAEAAARPLRRVAVACEDDRGPLEALDHAGGDDADDALVPAVARHHDRPGFADLVRLGLVLRDGRLEDLLLHLATTDVQLPELRRDGVGGLPVRREQQLEGPVGMRQAPGGVDARRQGEAERVGADRPRLDPGGGAQGRDARPGALADGPQPLGHPAAVVADERDRVRHGGERDEVDPLVGVGGQRPAVEPRRERPHGHVDDPDGRRQVLRRPAERRVGDDPGRPSAARQVVVEHDRLHPELRGAGQRLHGRRTAVDADEHPRPAGRQPLDRGARDPVALGEAARQERLDRPATAPQGGEQHGGRADPVAVVVAVHRDRLPAPDRPRQAVGCLPDPREVLGRREGPVGCQERPRGGGVAEAAADERPRDRLGHAEGVLERGDLGEARTARAPAHQRPERKMPTQSHTTSTIAATIPGSASSDRPATSA